MTGRRFRVDESGEWSGGGRTWLANARFAAQRHAILRGGEDAVPVIPRNVPADLRDLRRTIVLAPQNAWPWALRGVAAAELPRVLALRGLSEAGQRVAAGVLRISSSIPVLGTAGRYSPVLHNVLDPGFEEALEASLDVPVPDAAAGFLVIGSANSYRNLVTVVRAYAEYRAAGGRSPLLIAATVGPRAIMEDVRRAAASIPGIMLSWSGMPRASCLAYMRRASAVILPSRVEASPLTFLEAHAVNRRVLASRIPGHVEMGAQYAPMTPVSPGFFAPDDVHELAALMSSADPPISLTDLLSAPAEREERRERWAADVAGWLESLGAGERQ